LSRIDFADVSFPDIAAAARQIAAERGSVLDLYKILLHSPPVAMGWLHYLTAIRQQCGLAGHIRELVIMRVAILNGATYEAEQHAPFARREGVTPRQLESLDNWESSAEFTEQQRAVLAYADAMTRRIRVPDDVFLGIRSHFNDRLIVELTATVAAYNMVSRFLEALEIHATP
jgi:alkylhydroperoxidase family enzyme